MRPARSIALAAALLAGSIVPASTEPEDEFRLPERIDRALRDMMEDVKPTLDEALEYLRSFGAMDDPRHYEMPEILPNGDIIIRRREDAPEFDPDASPNAPGAPPADDLPDEPEKGVRT
jgi:hypothetical protein